MKHTYEPPPPGSAYRVGAVGDAARCREAAAAGNLDVLLELVTPCGELQEASGSFALLAAQGGHTWAVDLLETLSGVEWLEWDAGPMCEELLRNLTPPQPSLAWARAVFARPPEDDLRLQLVWTMEFYCRMFWASPLVHAAREGNRRTHWFLANKARYIPGLWEAAHGDLTALLALENVDMTEACRTAAGAGQLDLLKDLYARGVMPLDLGIVTEAAGAGHLPMLKWLMSLGRCVWDEETACAAVQAPGEGGLAVAAHLLALKPNVMLDAWVLEAASLYAPDALFQWLFSQPGAQPAALPRARVAEGTAACRLRWLAGKGWQLTEGQQRSLEELRLREAAVQAVLARGGPRDARQASLADVPDEVLRLIFREAGLGWRHA